MLTDRHLHDIAQRVPAAARSPLKVIVFGSYGRGDATEDSDLDLLVVERNLPDASAEHLRLREVVGTIGVGVDLLLMPLAEFVRRRNWASSPVYWASREGRVLFMAPNPQSCFWWYERGSRAALRCVRPGPAAPTDRDAHHWHGRIAAPARSTLCPARAESSPA